MTRPGIEPEASHTEEDTLLQYTAALLMFGNSEQIFPRKYDRIIIIHLELMENSGSYVDICVQWIYYDRKAPLR